MDDKVLHKTIGLVGQSVPHDSSELHVTGEATYIDDIPEPQDLLHLAVGLSSKPHAQIVELDLEPVRRANGVIDVLTAEDILGRNNFGLMLDDDPILASGTVQHVGQAIFAVAANTVDQARKAARLANVVYDELPAILDPVEAVQAGSFVLPSETLSRGDSAAAIKSSEHQLQRRLELGGQDQFYLEDHIAMALPKEGGDIFVYSSTQHPGEVQHLVAAAIGKTAKDIVVECRRMGGAFGGKESQPGQIACIASLMAVRTGRPCKLRLDRDVDMVMTGKRHDFVIDYDVGFEGDGVIADIEFVFMSRCGMSADLSGPINDRAMFHCDNAYFLENIKVVSHRCKTNTVSNTAFRGFGGPQGMFAIEAAIGDIARYLDIDPVTVRRRNYYDDGERNTTSYGQTVDDNILNRLTDELLESSCYETRVDEIRNFNANSPILRRGIAFTPVKFGISFTASQFNQAGALLNVYSDGTVHLNHGGTEMGQGLFTKVAQVVASEFQIDISNIKITASDTSKVPNASATAASSGADINGKAAQAAARTIKGSTGNPVGRG